MAKSCDDVHYPRPKLSEGAFRTPRGQEILFARPEKQYSLCGDPSDPSRYRVAILREPTGRGGSAYFHDHVGVGDRLAISLRATTFALEPAQRYLFIAGGIGITPILPMLAAARAAGADWQLLYGGRGRASKAFLDELADNGDRVTVAPEHEVGLLDLQTTLAQPIEGTKIYCCGPGPRLDAVADHCRSWPTGTLRIEHFAPRTLPESANTSFEVELARSGISITVPAEGSILDVVLGAGVDVPSACGSGTCGTCETVVCAGTPEHRDSILTEEERRDGEYMMICVSRSTSDRLVLDL